MGFLGLTSVITGFDSWICFFNAMSPSLEQISPSKRAIEIFKDLNKVKQASFGCVLSLLAFRALRDEIVQCKNTILSVVV